MIPRHIFGPVLSRRLGLSLGIDLVPYKTCSYDCVYCECGSNPRTTPVRREFFPIGEVIEELNAVLSAHPRLDTVTFAGSGEPTLSRSLGPVIAFLRQQYPEYAVTVLTNGSLLSDPEVQAELLPADRVIPTLTSVYQETFERIHRPHPGWKIDQVIGAMAEFRKKYHGALWLEIFIIPGVNTTDRELDGLAAAIRQIDPDAIQLNTLDRPPAESWVREASIPELEQIAQRLGRPGSTMIAGQRQRATFSVQERTDPADLVKALLRRRPCTAEDLVRATGLDAAAVGKIIALLEQDGEIASQQMPRGLFYRMRDGA